MSERLHREGWVTRIAITQIDAALAVIADPDADEAETIHTVRQQLKRLRALVRLPRSHLHGWREENAAFRDLAGRLGRTRDADVLAETFDRLAGKAGIRAPLLRAEVTSSTPGVATMSASRAQLLQGEIATGLVAARDRAAAWHLDVRGFRLIGPGVRHTYEDMCAAERRAVAHATPANFHDWRKQTKYHANQLALLKPVAPEIFKSHRKIADRLANTLGEHHDLDALATAMRRLEGGGKRRRLLGAIGKRNRKLEKRAFRLGAELTAERPHDFLRRIKIGWKSRWR